MCFDYVVHNLREILCSCSQMEMKREVRLIGPRKSKMVATVTICWQKETSEGTMQKLTSNVGTLYKSLLKNLLDNITKEVIGATQS